MIETCLTFNMSKEECMEALSENANINPIITSTGLDLSYHIFHTFDAFYSIIPMFFGTGHRYIFEYVSAFHKLYINS